MGLVSRVWPAEELRAEARKLAEELAARPPLACMRAKVAMAAAETSDASTAASVEVEAFASLFGAEDTSEGLAAFLEKRTPTFRGR